MTKLAMWILLGLGGVLILAGIGFFISRLFISPDPDDLFTQQVIEQNEMDGLNANQSDPEALLQLNWSKILASDMKTDVAVRRATRMMSALLCLICGFICLVWAALFRGLLEIRERFDAFALYQRMPHPGDASAP